MYQLRFDDIAWHLDIIRQFAGLPGLGQENISQA